MRVGVVGECCQGGPVRVCRSTSCVHGWPLLWSRPCHGCHDAPADAGPTHPVAPAAAATAMAHQPLVARHPVVLRVAPRAPHLLRGQQGRRLLAGTTDWLTHVHSFLVVLLLLLP